MFFGEFFYYISILALGYIVSFIVLYKYNKTANERDKYKRRCKLLEEKNKKLEYELFMQMNIVPEIEKKE